MGTFTNFAQNDQLLYTLHTYVMYLKFGFADQIKTHVLKSGEEPCQECKE